MSTAAFFDLDGTLIPGSANIPLAKAAFRQGFASPSDLLKDLRNGVSFLLKDYDYFLTLPDFLGNRLEALRTLQSRETLDRWQQLIHDSDWPTLVRELLEQHYDPLYQRSQDRNYTGTQDPGNFSTDDLSDSGIKQLAATIVQSRMAQMA